MFWTHLIRVLILPPGGVLLALGLGLALMRRWPRLGRGLCVGAALALYLLSIPPVSGVLIRSLEICPQLTAEEARGSGAQAIVVLGGGYLSDPPEVNTASLARIRYGVQLHRITGLPIMAVSGNGSGGDDSEAGAMRAVARDEMGVPVAWIEDRSRNTAENARFSAVLLKRHGIRRILLVSHSYHMRRALRSFRATGLEVVCAPLRPARPGPWDTGIFLVLPKVSNLAASTEALEEWMGILWYGLRGD